jgi:type II secretory pathway pseudopilin PulG
VAINQQRTYLLAGISAAEAMRTCGQQSSIQSGVSAGRRALTLLEMMVSVTLLAVIMIGLLAMFSHTQKALHVAATQTDVFENARGAIQLLSRDLSEMSPHEVSDVISATNQTVNNPAGPLTLPGSGGTVLSQPIFFSEAFWLARKNDDWQGTGYYVEGANNGVGTLYRYSETTNLGWAPSLLNRFYNDPNIVTHRVSDGIVHFQLTAVYPETNNTSTNFVSSSEFLFSNVLPAFVDIDLGVLEPGTLKQFEALTNNPAAAQRFLTNQVGRIHFFRERVPIRNFINPYRANEVP